MADAGEGFDGDAAAPVIVGTELARATWDGEGGNGHTYVLMEIAEGSTWSNAAAAATSQGGYLVSITDEEEAAFVYSLAMEVEWPSDANGVSVGPAIGGRLERGLWRWTSGELWSYTDFGSGEPSNLHGEAGGQSVLQLRRSTGQRPPYWSDAAEDGELHLYLYEIGEPDSAETTIGGAGVYSPEDIPEGCVRAIEITPSDVSSSERLLFSVLPTQDPALFGLTGDDVRKVNFDTTPDGASLASGTTLTDEYAASGVTMNGITVRDDAFQGPASAPNVAWIALPQIFTFTEPVSAAGIINTSPDQDTIEIWSGPNRTGQLLLRFTDAPPGTYNMDRFLGARLCEGHSIGSIALYNRLGGLELDELILEVAAE